ncbi:MAG: hypothetical protein ACREND_05890, partial [Gemmatimonadaceae bacterium]
LIGQGAIGVEPFRWLLADRRASGVPLILETPHRDVVEPEEDVTPDPNDVEMLQLLRSLASS